MNTNEDARSGSKTSSCGTLVYTRRALVALFAWMLWGDFCFTLMEAVVPSILPLKLRGLDAPNVLIGFIMTTLPGIFNVGITPWVSFKSDRHRGRWGRRIPFILGTMPFLTLSLIFIGVSTHMGTWVHGAFFSGTQVTQAQVTIVLLAIFAASFDLFNMFVNTVYWYLFNDVVPQEWMGRFMGWFRVVGTLTSALYQFFIFKFAETHVREIFLGAALLYFFGFGLMCLRVKEGQYPPEDENEKKLGFMGQVKLYARECFSMRFYWDTFLQYAIPCIGGCILVFDVFFMKSLGLSLDNIGKIGAISAITVPLCLLFSGVFVDRWHPIRVAAYCGAFEVFFLQFLNWVWLFVPSAEPLVYVGIAMVVGAFFRAPLRAITETSGMTRLMRLLPHEKYGQFNGAIALIRALALMLGGVLAGLYVDFWKGFYPEGNYAYRFNFLWMGTFTLIGFCFHYRNYRAWKRLGGATNYVPPEKPFKLSQLQPYPGDDGKICKGLLVFTGLSATGLILGNLAWVAYFTFWSANRYNATVFTISAVVNVLLFAAYVRFMKFMERP